MGYNRAGRDYKIHWVDHIISLVVAVVICIGIVFFAQRLVEETAKISIAYKECSIVLVEEYECVRCGEKTIECFKE